MKAVKWLDEHFEECFMVVLLVLIAVVSLMQVIVRNIETLPALKWAEEFCRFCWIGSVFLSLPYTIRNVSMLRVCVLLDLLPQFFIQLSQVYERWDLHLLGCLQNATYRLTTANKPLNTLEDYKNLQIRTMENSNHMNFWSAIGANPTPLAFSELYFSLSSGAIDAQENAAA